MGEHSEETLSSIVSKIKQWKDPTWEDFEHIEIVDKEKGVQQANFHRTFISLSDYNKVCNFIVSLQEELK